MVASNGQVIFDEKTPRTHSPREIEDGVFRALMRGHASLNANTSVLPMVDGRIGGGGSVRGNSWGDSVGGMGDLDEQCGYPNNLTPDWYLKAYSRWGIAARVVDLWPDECWAIYPEVYETNTPEDTEFETAWKALTNNALVYHYLHRVDRLSGIGEFAVLFLGLDDGGNLDKPPVGINKRTGKGKWRERKLNYVRAFDQSLVRISRRDTNQNSPRFGQPTEYVIQFSADAVSHSETTSGEPLIKVVGSPDAKKLSQKIHWTRILHVADNREVSEIYGVSRLQRVANYLHDLRKVSGGSAEMFHRGGFPGYAFETYPDLAGDAAIDEESLRETINAYQKGYRRYLATVGGKWNSLSPQVADPDSHLSWYIKLICATIGVPFRIFMGSEEGHLAGASDADAWKSRCSSRQVKYMEPMILRPFVDRLIDLGVLPQPKLKGSYFVNWKDLRSLSDAERVEVALKKVQALTQYTTGFVNEVFPKHLLYTLIFGYTEEEATAIEEELKRDPPKPRDEVDPSLKPKPVVGSPGAGRTGKTPNAKSGRPAKTPPEGKPRSGVKPGSGAKKPNKK